MNNQERIDRMKLAEKYNEKNKRLNSSWYKSLKLYAILAGAAIVLGVFLKLFVISDAGLDFETLTVCFKNDAYIFVDKKIGKEQNASGPESGLNSSTRYKIEAIGVRVSGIEKEYDEIQVVDVFEFRKRDDAQKAYKELAEKLNAGQGRADNVHYYCKKDGRIIVKYVGSNEDVLDTLFVVMAGELG